MKKLLAILFIAASAHAADKLLITKAGPVGEIAQLSEANEVRVVFNEPMVVIGRIPKVVEVPWFHIAPEVKGTFRWAGTTTLVFTPDPKKGLPFATKYDVTIDADAKAVSGHTLGKAYHFSFTTPTMQLTSVDWYRKSGNTIVFAMRFNQPVDAATVGPHLSVRYHSHEVEVPALPSPSRMTPAERAAFDAKVAKVKAIASSSDPVSVTFPADWNKKQWKPKPELLVAETAAPVPFEAQLDIALDADLAKSPERIHSGKVQQYTLTLDHALFIKEISCTADCDPDYSNRIRLTAGVSLAKVKAATTVTDITDPAKPVKVQPGTPKHEDGETDWDTPTTSFALDELGYSLIPAHHYLVRIDPTLKADDGQTLDYTWIADVDFLHKAAFSSFGDGHGVWESSGGPQLPFYARNIKNVQQWLAPVQVDQLMPTILALQKDNFAKAPPVPSKDRKLAPVPDKIQSYGVDVTSATTNGKGLVWVAVRDGEPIAKAKIYGDEVTTRGTLVQVTNLGVSVKDSPQNTLVFVTTLDNASPVAGAKVTIRDLANTIVWSGTTDDKGLAIAPSTPHLRFAPDVGPASAGPGRAEARPTSDDEDAEVPGWEALDQLHFIVTAEKDGDVAYAASDFSDGIRPWDFDLTFDLAEADPLLRGTIFADRGVYKLGEDVHLKAILRSDTPTGVQLLSAGTSVTIVVRDAHDKEVDRRTLALNEWSTAEWTWKVPAEGVLGTYRVMARIAGQRLRAYGDFLVAAYRRPDFRVDATLAGASSIAGAKLDGVITGRYLFGGVMAKMPVKWTFAKMPLFDVPHAIRERYSEDQYTFLDYEHSSQREVVQQKETKLDAKGELRLSLDTDIAAAWPFLYELEGDVTDVTRQKIAGRATMRVDPAPWYIGIRNLPYFADAAKGVDTAIVAAAIDGTATPGVTVDVQLHRIQWNSVRHAEGNGFYTWESERKELEAGKWSITSESKPVDLHIPLTEGGEYVLIASAKDAAGHATSTRAWFYASGGGYTAWERHDHNRIDLVPEKKTWKPGDTARILVKSPWEHATALVTTEREGVRTWKQFPLTSTQQTISVPITERDIPNVFVSILLLKGRTKESGGNDEADPGKPAFRLGYTELEVEDAAKRLTVDVKSDRAEYRPATKANIEVNVRDAKGAGARSEVTLWAVDYGVLSLTAYKTPDVLASIYLRKSLQVVNEESREKVISRRVLTPKGGTDGGGGGRDSGPGTLRKDFRVLAFWVGSLVTDNKGRAKTTITLPESLSTYRIMAVAGDKVSRFGWGQNELRINKPLMITPAFPRFLSLGDKAAFGGVVHSQRTSADTGVVTMKSLDPDIITIGGCGDLDVARSAPHDGECRIDVPAGANMEVRFSAVAKAIGTARIQMSVKSGGESDAFEDVIPVRILIPADTVAAYGEANPQAKETLEVPKDALPSIGGLHVELASTQMVGLAEGAEYLVTYPYGCAEQRSSAALALMLAGDLGEAFKLQGIDAPRAKQVAQSTVKELYKFQCGNGGFAYWAGDCTSTSPYLTANVLHVFQRAQKLGYDVDKDVLDRAYKNLESSLNETRPTNEGYFPWFTSWQAFALKTLVEGGRNEDSHVNFLYEYRDRMPIFALAFLADAMLAKNDHDRFDELHRRLTNAIAPEAGEAHAEELKDDLLGWLWSSNARSTAIVLDTLVRSGQDEQLSKQMVRWLMHARTRGRWGNTQENAWAMESLVDYYRKYESVTPDFTAIVTAANETIAKDVFKGRSTEAKSHDVPIVRLKSGPVEFNKEGAGTLFWLMRLKYASPALMNEPRTQGFTVERKYTLENSKTPATSFAAGDMIRVTITIHNTKERRFVAVTDPIPAGTEPVEAWFATTSAQLANDQAKQSARAMWWQRGGFDHIERHDDRVELFATRLSEGAHEFSYLVRATTSGTFTAAPLRAEEMYAPEIFGRTASESVEIK